MRWKSPVENMKIPNFVYNSIACLDDYDDGDRWPLIDGWSVEYSQRPVRIRNGRADFGDFIVRHKGEVITTLSSTEAKEGCDE